MLSKGVRIGFGEVDYVASEGDGRARVLLTQAEAITENLTVTLMAVTFAEFFGAGRNLTEHFNEIADKLPDPAEYEELGEGTAK